MPKGALHVHNAVLTHYITGKYVLDFHQGDVFWCTADPGWVTGTSYGIIAPLVNGVTSIIDEDEFDATRWYSILEEHKVTIWYTAPTAIRRLIRMEIKPIERYNLENLRIILSVGEPLQAEAVIWGEKTFGFPILDNWWQTETGGIMVANYPSMKVKPGSMGKPLPGIEAAIAEVNDNEIRILSESNIQGHLVLKKGFPSQFRGYLHEEERYKKCFIGEWYLSGDLAKKDADGYFQNEETKMNIMGFARKELGPAVAPKEIEFIDSIPKTRSGKILRRLLKARELGLPEGDISTLENP